ncbi:MAG: MBL fold metallo-hydrolase [Acidobacteriota bacterium]
MAEIFFLGTGGAVATPARDNTSFLLRCGEDLVLVDCPGSLTAKIQRLNLDPARVGSIVLTHTHPDHIYGLPAFVLARMLEEREIVVWGSAETVAFSRRLLDLFRLRGPTIKIRVRFRALRPGQKARLEDSLRLQAFPVSHLPSSLAYRFDFEDGKRLLYSGDTPPSASLFEEAKGIDCLVHEASAPSRFFKRYPDLRRLHTSSLEVGEWSERVGVKCLIPCHFFGEIAFSLAEIRREIRNHFRGTLIIPRDGQRVML